jgi:hypothetical protein
MQMRACLFMKRTNGSKIYEYYNYVVKETVPLYL